MYRTRAISSRRQELCPLRSPTEKPLGHPQYLGLTNSNVFASLSSFTRRFTEPAHAPPTLFTKECPMVRRDMNTRNGFTFMELVIVMAVVGILIVLAVSNYNATQTHKSERRTKKNIQVVHLAIEGYMYRYDGLLPTRREEIMNFVSDDLRNPFLNQVPPLIFQDGIPSDTLSYQRGAIIIFRPTSRSPIYIVCGAGKDGKLLPERITSSY